MSTLKRINRYLKAEYPGWYNVVLCLIIMFLCGGSFAAGYNASPQEEVSVQDIEQCEIIIQEVVDQKQLEYQKIIDAAEAEVVVLKEQQRVLELEIVRLNAELKKKENPPKPDWPF